MESCHRHKTLNNFVEGETRFYKQEPGELLSSTRLGFYMKRWLWWVRAGLTKAQISCAMQNPPKAFA